MDLNKKLMDSAKLDERLQEFLLPADLAAPQRVRCSAILCGVAFEHAESVKILVASGNFTSATGLARLQYEALVRAMWVFYAASDLFVGKMMSDLTVESARVGNNLPIMSEMLASLVGKAPKDATDKLLEFKEYSWKPVSSFVHGGIHAIEMARQGLSASAFDPVIDSIQRGFDHGGHGSCDPLGKPGAPRQDSFDPGGVRWMPSTANVGSWPFR